MVEKLLSKNLIEATEFLQSYITEIKKKMEPMSLDMLELERINKLLQAEFYEPYEKKKKEILGLKY